MIETKKKAVMLVGVPGCGKTTLMKRFIQLVGGIEAYESGEFESCKLVKFMRNKNFGYYIVGVYDDSEDAFQGTDKLSMAVQPDFDKFLDEIDGYSIIFEGDRLLTSKTIDSILARGYELTIVGIEHPSKKILKARYEARNSHQNQQFIDSRITKVARITSRLDLMEHFSHIVNETPEDLERNAKYLTTLIYSE